MAVVVLVDTQSGQLLALGGAAAAAAAEWQTWHQRRWDSDGGDYSGTGSERWSLVRVDAVLGGGSVGSVVREWQQGGRVVLLICKHEQQLEQHVLLTLVDVVVASWFHPQQQRWGFACQPVCRYATLQTLRRV